MRTHLSFLYGVVQESAKVTAVSALYSLPQKWLFLRHCHLLVKNTCNGTLYWLAANLSIMWILMVSQTVEKMILITFRTMDSPLHDPNVFHQKPDFLVFFRKWLERDRFLTKASTKNAPEKWLTFPTQNWLLAWLRNSVLMIQIWKRIDRLNTLLHFVALYIPKASPFCEKVESILRLWIGNLYFLWLHSHTGIWVQLCH